MPQTTNNLVNRIVKLIRDIFNANRYEYGTLAISHANNDKLVTVRTEADVLRVWFSVQPSSNPYNGEMNDGLCYVSEAVVVPGGFQFKFRVSGECNLSWFAVEG